MNAGAIARWFMAFTALFTLGGCSDGFPDYNYKMTIYADGKSFSSVRRIEQEQVASMVDSAGVRVDRTLIGQAVILDIDGRGYYALLTRPDNADYSLLTVTAQSLGRYVSDDAKPMSEFDKAAEEYRRDQQSARDPGSYLKDIAGRSRAMTQIEGPRDLPRSVPNHDQHRGPRIIETWPMFVTFDDPADPTSVREVSPDAIGVTRITIEITDEDVSTGIEERFSWWEQYRGLRLDGKSSISTNMSAPTLNSRLTINDFDAGDHQ